MTLVLALACSAPYEQELDTGWQPVSNALPEITGVTLRPEPARAGDDLEVSVVAGDADGDAIAHTYIWYVDDRPQADTGAILPAFTAWGGAEVEVTVTVSDGVAYGESVTVTTVLANSAPEVVSVSVLPSSPGVEDVLECSAVGIDDDGGLPKLTYRWLVNGVADGVVAQTHGGGLAKGTQVQCEVTATDGADSSVPVVSAAVTIGNSPPRDPVFTLEPDPPSPCSTGRVVILVDAYDADGDPVTYEAEFLDPGGGVVHDGLTWGKGVFIEGASYTARVVPKDPTSSGPPVELAFVARVGGEALGDLDDNDCDGAVDEWLDHAWQAQGIWWDTVDSNQAGNALAVGDLNGDGHEDLVLGRTGPQDVVVLLGDAFDPATPVVGTPSVVMTDANNTLAMAIEDVDGDGLGDVLVGSPRYDNAWLDAGALFLVDGQDVGSGRLRDLARWKLEGEATSDELGVAADLGDLDGDGHADVVLGRPLVDAPDRDAGEVRVFDGGALGDLDSAAVVVDGDEREVLFGSFVQVVPDLNGDGRPELVAGAPDADGGGTSAGLVAVFYGGTLGSALASGAMADANVTVAGGDVSARLGQQPVALADVDGDGVRDLAVSWGTTSGELGVLSGALLRAGGLFTTADAFATVEHTVGSSYLGLFGRGPDLADLDGDGLAELAAGASGRGEAFVWSGATLATGGALDDGDAVIRVAGEDSGDSFGKWVGFADADADGVDDLVVTAYRAEAVVSRGGATYLFRPPFGIYPSGWAPECDAVDGRAYCRELLPWTDARARCQSFGGDLARVGDETAADAVLLGTGSRALPATPRGRWWIGLNDRTVEGTWAWLDEGTATSFARWGTSEPLSGTSRNCAAVNDETDGDWGAWSCDSAYFYVCDL